MAAEHGTPPAVNPSPEEEVAALKTRVQDLENEVTEQAKKIEGLESEVANLKKDEEGEPVPPPVEGEKTKHLKELLLNQQNVLATDKTNVVDQEALIAQTEHELAEALAKGE